MTRYSDPSEFQTGSRAEHAERLILASRGAILWERVWPALWPASGIAGLFAAAALFDLFEPLPWTLHALILSGAITGIGLCLYFSLQNFRLPGWMEGARRLERSSGLKHRPISEAGDAMAVGAGDPIAEELWKLHIKALLASVGRLRLAWPSPGLPRRDPRALRFVVLALVIVGLAFAGWDSARRLWAGFNDTSAATRATVDAWIDPPPYTGMAPVYLTPGMKLAVPAGSTLNLRVHGAGHTPGLSLDSDTGAQGGFNGAQGEYAATYRVLSDADVRVRSGGRAIGDWSITAIPDHPPSIAFVGKPDKTEHQVLRITFKASDDYGVTAVRAIITPRGRQGAKPVVVDLDLATTTKSVTQTSFKDLTAHPYAGLDVDIVLQAVDGLGQVTSTRPVTMKLPARVFITPLARALIEQRQNLATDSSPQNRSRVVRMLDALTIAPQLFYADQSGVYTGIRAARWALAHATYPEHVQHVEDLLWQIAVSLERGGLLSAAEELRRLQAEIAQALASGAPQEVIDELLQRYQDAMQRYMQALAANPPQGAQDQPPPGTRTLSQKDLQDILKAIQQLNAAGDREGAARMMALLQSLLENLKLSNGGGQGDTPQDKAMKDAIGRLDDLVGKQRELLDKTFKGRQGEHVDPKDMQKQQGDIQKQLNDIQKGLGDQKVPPPSDLGRAGRSMGQSGQELGGNDLNGSSVDQKNALDALRSAAGELAQKLAKEGQDRNGNQGADQDPLGRDTGRNPFAGSGVKVPGPSDLKRAHDILMELRRRAAERGRPQQELDYIDRLLRQF